MLHFMVQIIVHQEDAMFYSRALQGSLILRRISASAYTHDKVFVIIKHNMMMNN